MKQTYTAQNYSKLSKLAISALFIFACSITTGCFAGTDDNLNKNDNVPVVSVSENDYAPSSSNYNLSNEYASLPEDNVFKVADADETFKFIEHGTGILMLGYPECPWCQEYVPMVNDIAKEHGIEKIVYYDVRKSRLDDPESYAKLLELLGGEDSYPRYNPDGELRIFVPFIAFIDHGKVVFADDETCLLDSREISPEDYWTDEQKAAFASKMDEPMKQIESAVKSCSSCSE